MVVPVEPEGVVVVAVVVGGGGGWRPDTIGFSFRQFRVSGFSVSQARA